MTAHVYTETLTALSSLTIISSDVTSDVVLEVLSEAQRDGAVVVTDALQG